MYARGDIVLLYGASTSHILLYVILSDSCTFYELYIVTKLKLAPTYDVASIHHYITARSTTREPLQKTFTENVPIYSPTYTRPDQLGLLGLGDCLVFMGPGPGHTEAHLGWMQVQKGLAINHQNTFRLYIIRGGICSHNMPNYVAHRLA